MNLPFNQPLKTRDCGFRCLYAISNPSAPYEQWLYDNFRFFNPKESGINFNDICEVLKYHKINYEFTELNERDTFIIYSGNWLKPQKNHGHYFILKAGIVYCSTKSEPYHMHLNEVINRLKAKTTETAYRSLRVW